MLGWFRRYFRSRRTPLLRVGSPELTAAQRAKNEFLSNMASALAEQESLIKTAAHMERHGRATLKTTKDGRLIRIIEPWERGDGA